MDDVMNASNQKTHRIIDLSAQQGTVPIRCFGGRDFLPDEAALRQLQEVAGLDGVESYIAVLPDVHHKAGNPSPSGTVVVTSGVILPRAVDDGMNCGMRSMATDLSARDLTPDVIDRLFGRLLETVPPAAHETPLVSAPDCEDMLVHGLGKLVEPLDLPPDELARTENGGRFELGLEPNAIREALPRRRIQKHCDSIGTLGTGNHFLELQEVVEVCDPEAARSLGLEVGQAMFMLHSASAKLGKRVLAEVHAEAEQLFRAPGASELFSIPVDTEIGQRYLACMTAAMHAGFANRAAIGALVRRTLKEVLGESSGLRLVGDSGHETIQPELHGGRELWVHRHGASHAVPPGRAVVDPELRALGLPVPVAGCLGADSFVCLGRPGIESTYDALPHGAGRVLGKEQSAERFDPAEVVAEVENRGVRLYRYGSDNIAGQAPWGFKNVAHVVRAMTELDLLRPVVRVRPLAALKG
jgi:tRNA-splicing ligase RtcB